MNIFSFLYVYIVCLKYYATYDKLGGLMDTYKKALQKIKHDQIYKCNYTNLICQSKMSGPTGPTGPVPDFFIGSVITGAPGTSAEVTLRKI